MFHREADASKVALVHLVARLKADGFRLLDTQFVTPHLATLGAVEVPRSRYQRMVEAALAVDAIWTAAPLEPAAALALVRNASA
jgi:leucyl/phenylalanyl-tRNA--protein transferase